VKSAIRLVNGLYNKSVDQNISWEEAVGDALVPPGQIKATTDAVRNYIRGYKKTTGHIHMDKPYTGKDAFMEITFGKTLEETKRDEASAQGKIKGRKEVTTEQGKRDYVKSLLQGLKIHADESLGANLVQQKQQIERLLAKDAPLMKRDFIKTIDKMKPIIRDNVKKAMEHFTDERLTVMYKLRHGSLPDAKYGGENLRAKVRNHVEGYYSSLASFVVLGQALERRGLSEDIPIEFQVFSAMMADGIPLSEQGYTYAAMKLYDEVLKSGAFGEVEGEEEEE
jgi:hypothetical protein